MRGGGTTSAPPLGHACNYSYCITEYVPLTDKIEENYPVVFLDCSKRCCWAAVVHPSCISNGTMDEDCFAHLLMRKCFLRLRFKQKVSLW